MRPGACNFFPVLLQREEICSSKLSTESIMIPSKVFFMFVVIEALPIDTSKRADFSLLQEVPGVFHDLFKAFESSMICLKSLA